MARRLKTFAFLAAVSIALMTAFNLGGKSMIQGQFGVNLTLAVISINEGIIEKEKLINAYVKAEASIDDVTFQNR